MGVDLGPSQLASLLQYFQELQKWSKRINLIARSTDEQQVIEKHFLDSLTLYPLLARHRGGDISLLDVGTGAGFPGLVLAAVMSEVRVSLLEPRLKRVSFLRHVVRTLQLTNVEIIADRVESFTAKGVRPYRYVTSRAVAAPAKALSLLHPFLEYGAQAILMAAKEESVQVVKQTAQPYRLVEVITYRLPFSGAGRVIGLVGLNKGDSDKAPAGQRWSAEGTGVDVG